MRNVGIRKRIVALFMALCFMVFVPLYVVKAETKVREKDDVKITDTVSNKEWVKRLRDYLVEGGAFITLDAIYLGGEKGLLEQLRAAGYRVRSVNR